MIAQASDNLAISIKGKFLRVATLRDEPYECLTEPHSFFAKFKQGGIGADLFTFMEELADTSPKHGFYHENDHIAVLPITSYEDWFEKRIGFKPRNKIRKASKAGVELRPMELNNESIRGIMGIYNESPLVQGRANWHYGKDFETMKKMLGTFPHRSDFVGAFYHDEMIGFIKLVRGKQFAGLMHIISKVAHRDKAPTNALIAKAVEICATQKLTYLQYGIWSRRGLGVFKTSHAFTCLNVPRYFLPLNLKGRLMLKLGLHRSFRDYLPDRWVDKAVDLRNNWNQFKYRSLASKALVRW
jgi:hypothetical protein